MADVLKGRAGDPTLSSTKTQTNVSMSISPTQDNPAHHCRRCGRPLRSKLALLAGYGSTCALRQAAEYWQPTLDVEAVGHE